MQERGSECAGALPALPRRCGHCPTPVRLRPLWAAPPQIRIGDNRAFGGGGRSCLRLWVGRRSRNPEPPRGGDSECAGLGGTPPGFGGCQPGLAHHPAKGTGRGRRGVSGRLLSLSFRGWGAAGPGWFRGPRHHLPWRCGLGAEVGRGGVGSVLQRGEWALSFLPSSCPGAGPWRGRNGPEASDRRAPGEQRVPNLLGIPSIYPSHLPKVFGAVIVLCLATPLLAWLDRSLLAMQNPRLWGAGFPKGRLLCGVERASVVRSCGRS